MVAFTFASTVVVNETKHHPSSMIAGGAAAKRIKGSIERKSPLVVCGARDEKRFFLETAKKTNCASLQFLSYVEGLFYEALYQNA